MAVALRSRSRARPRARRPEAPLSHQEAPGGLLGAETVPMPLWPVQRVLRDLRDWDALERRCALAQLEAKSYRQLAGRLQQERDAARRTLAILAQQELERCWVLDGEGAP